VIPDRSSKSIGAEDTFEEDVADLDVLRPRLHAQALRVGRRLRKAGLRTRVVQLKLKLDDFTLQTRRCTLERPTDDGQELYRHALALLERAPLPRPVRLTGVSAQELDEVGKAQLGLFGEPPRRSDALNRALDAIAERFGRGAVAPADVLSLEDGEPLDELRTQAGVSRLDLSGEPKRSSS
jgi:DNA polymerase-4